MYYRKKYKFSQQIRLSKLLPNVLTIAGLAIGFSSVRFAIDDKWEQAVVCVLVSMVIDALDGKIARLLNATTRFGAELDSLCDFVNFGITPSLLIYFWNFDSRIKLLSWWGTLFFAICMLIRLARFNTMVSSDNLNIQHLMKKFFVGVPAPAGGMLMLMPIILEFEILQDIGWSFKGHSIIILIYQIIIGLLVASRIPTMSLKAITIERDKIWMLFVFFALLLVSLINHPWYTIPMSALAYLISIYFSIKEYRKIPHNS